MRVFSSCATRSTSARRICRAAAGAGTTVTVDMEDHTLTAATLAIVTALRADFPGTGAVLQARLRRTGTYELQMLHGVRPVEQRRLAAAGERVRVYVPYGEEWYGYLVRRLAERPQNLSLFLTSLISEK